MKSYGTSRRDDSTGNVYDWCMGTTRTNIEIDDDDVQAVMDRFGLRTKKEAVALALRRLAGQPMTRAEAEAMRGAGAIADVPADRGPRTA